MLKMVGVLVVSLGLTMLILTERCRRKPTRCTDGFISRMGFTRSWIVLRYLDLSPEERRKIFLENPRVRKYYLIESYLWGLVAVISGIGLILEG